VIKVYTKNESDIAQMRQGNEIFKGAGMVR